MRPVAYGRNENLLLFVILLVDRLSGVVGDKLLFIMIFCPFIHSVLRGDAECYADNLSP